MMGTDLPEQIEKKNDAEHKHPSIALFLFLFFQAVLDNYPVHAEHEVPLLNTHLLLQAFF